ncbi:MAG TPA: transcriptional regulator [Pseudomonas sp.]|nr:transcriptional regulator [Pseudomonas sp.]
MPAKKNAVTTPLHLLQQLSKSLVVHLEKACTDAQKDAEILLAKLEKQRGKTQEKLIKARAKLDEAGNAGKSKAQSKARARLAELDDMLALLQARQSETLSYLADLKRDAEQSLSLARGVTQVEEAAAQALASRSKASPARSATTQRKAAPATTRQAPAKQSSSSSSTAARKPAATTRARPAASKVASGKSAAANTSSGQAAATSAAKRPARPASSRAKPKASTAKPSGAAKPAAARKPASAKAGSADQPAPPASS